jgi:hypothetical protein
MRIHGACQEHILGLQKFRRPLVHDCSAYLLLRDLQAEVLKFNFFKNRGFSWLSSGLPPVDA